MRHNILGFDQVKATELGLNLDELMILRHLHDFASSGKMETLIHDNKMYYWVKYDKFVDDLPILGMKKTRVMEIFNNNLSEKPLDWEARFSSMSESSKKRAKSFKHIGVLKSFTKKDKDGTYSYFTFTDLFYSLLPSITSNDDDINKKDLPAPTDKPNNQNKIDNNIIYQNKEKYASKNKENYKKTKFHNFEETFDKYSEDELDNIIEKSQKEKWEW